MSPVYALGMRVMARSGVAIVMLVVALPAFAARALIDYDAGSPRIEFAVDDLETALRHRRFPTERHDSRRGAPAPGPEVLVRIAVVASGNVPVPAAIGPEGFVIRSSLV